MRQTVQARRELWYDRVRPFVLVNESTGIASRGDERNRTLTNAGELPNCLIRQGFRRNALLCFRFPPLHPMFRRTDLPYVFWTSDVLRSFGLFAYSVRVCSLGWEACHADMTKLDPPAANAHGFSPSRLQTRG